MNYQEAIDFLFSALPMYQRVGNTAFKKDLTNTLDLCEALDNPQHQFKSIHVAGTNGKGSSSHMLAAILQESDYKVGLYTSPHLKSFTERIKINGVAISEDSVVDFVNHNKGHIERIKPSFFEMTVVMAFDYFAKEKVDIAVIEVGLGGRLDSTNVITPEVSLITNIGYDHMEMLGDTLPQIAAEKAGIIKPGIPVVVSEKHSETMPVFEKVALARKSSLIFANEDAALPSTDLKGDYQKKNINGVLKVVDVLRKGNWKITDEAIQSGLSQVTQLTGLKGRWQTLNQRPLTICDTGHNREAFNFILNQIDHAEKANVHMVLGFVQEKNVTDLLEMIPQGAHITFCQSSVPRAMKLEHVQLIAEELGINANYVADVNEAIESVTAQASDDDFIFVGGSTFVVAEIKGL